MHPSQQRRDPDPLAALRTAMEQRDPAGFARCFPDGGGLRLPRPDGDIVLQEPDQIAEAAHELRVMLGDLAWTPSQRFLSSGQVVEEGVVRARMTGASRPEDEIRVPMRAVADLDPAGGIGSLTLWLDWAALDDPLGVHSPLGAASVLVAHARARDARGLQVIESAPPGDGRSVQQVSPTPATRPARPAAGVLWWRRYRDTVAGCVMAALAVIVLGWVALGVMHSLATRNRSTATGTLIGSAAEAQAGGGRANDELPARPGSRADLPVITPESASARPTVQRGMQFRFRSDLLFETNSTRLSEAARARLRNLAGTVRARRVIGTIQINGYTDDRGSTEFNLRLSKDRATAVAEALQGYLSGSRVELAPQAFGESHPAAANDTPEGQSRNRRVVVVLPEK
jgi:outer membrane protein OmpA-like peptidoglycan-associated protein